MLPRFCPDCGKELPPGLPEGTCPNCLLKLGVLTAAHERKESDVGVSVAGEKPGTRIGRYKLLERIGEGGFGTVWLAEQQEPVRRKVALKIIKPGMDTREVVARFEAERQSLALMDHPNIARVFDGGATASGRPYFVMELVKGVRITDYCDTQRLSTEERLKLFMEVCQAVQHAHQKGVIHRDLKPTNVLVTEQDGRAVPKVIDFGIAKATEPELTGKTFFTRFNQLIGTPAYMSPEQAGLGSLDVDTRGDIYSLGVLLYELLTGRTPFSNEELLKAGLDQVLRIIREKEPAKPSTQLSTLAGADLETIARQRAVEPARLNRLVRGDLDLIVMKCLEKERARRYETANGLARDIERHLNNEPVVAAAPSVAYQVAKFASRHRATLATAVAFVLLLIAGIVVSTWQAVRATRAEREDERLRQLAEANLQTARQAADRMLIRLAQEVRDKPHLIELSRKLLEDALEFHKSLLQQKRDDPVVRHDLAQSYARIGGVYQLLGDFGKSIEVRQQALALLEQLSRQQPGVAEYREELASIHEGLAFSLWATDRQEDDIAHTRKAFAIWEGLAYDFPDSPPYASRHINAFINLANALTGEEQLKAAEQAVAHYAAFREHFPAEPVDREMEAQIQHWYGNALQGCGRPDEAEHAYRNCQDLRTRLTQEHPENAGVQVDLAQIKQYLGELLYKTKRTEEGIGLLEEAAAIHEKILQQYPEYGPRSRRAGIIFSSLGKMLLQQNRIAEAEVALLRSVVIYTRATALLPNEPANRYGLCQTEYLLGELLLSTGRTNEAAQVFQGTMKRLDEMSREVPPLSALSRHQRDALKRITSVYQKLGYTKETAEWNRRLAEFEKRRSLSETNTSKP